MQWHYQHSIIQTLNLSSEPAIFSQIACHTTLPIHICNSLQRKVFSSNRKCVVKDPSYEATKCNNIKINEGDSPSSGVTAQMQTKQDKEEAVRIAGSVQGLHRSKY